MAGEMLWTTQSGYLTNNKLNKMFQKSAQPLTRFRQFVKFKEAFGKHQGESVNWLKVANVSTVGGTVAETSTMPESKQTLSWGTLTVGEYGNSIPYTFKLEALSEFDVMDIIKGGLLDDAVKCIDGSIERKFNECKLRYFGASATAGTVSTAGTAAGTNTSSFNAYHVRRMVDELKKRNVPGWSGLGGDYVCICSVEALSGLYADVESVWQYTESGYQKVLNGEVGRYYGCRFVEDTYATRYTYSAANRTSTAKSWAQAKSLDAYMFGSPTVREAIVVPEEIRVKVTTDYGRSKGLAWYFMGGWAIEWDVAADCRIIKWDSLA
jgi:N4-gp56 family major capsid protein